MAALSPQERRSIARNAAAARWTGQLPEVLRSLFWEYPFDELRLPQHQNEVLLKVLSYGSADQVAWLRRRLGDTVIRRWIIARKGRGLTPAQVAPWISSATARRWLKADPIGRLWAER
jgi:hypothetical protein